MNLPKVKMLQVSKCLIGLAVMMLQSCDVADNRRDMLCGNWESVEGKPDVLIYKEGEAYKVTVFRRSGLRRKLKPETYLLQEENGNLFMNTGFRIDVSYNEATDVLTFSPNGDYVRQKPALSAPFTSTPSPPWVWISINPGITEGPESGNGKCQARAADLQPPACPAFRHPQESQDSGSPQSYKGPETRFSMNSRWAMP